jgi:hypothetical protein
MLNRVLRFLLVACVIPGALRAASDPFVGKWKVNPAKSTLIDEMTVELAGDNRYKLTFEPGLVDTIVADGSDQPALGGTTFSITVKGPGHWMVVRKKDGTKLLSAEWTLSADGKRLIDAFTQYLPSGTTLFSTPLPDDSTLFLPYVYERTAGTSGFVGTWDSDSAKVKKGIELDIQPDQGDGLSFKRSDEDTTAYLGRRVDERRLEIAYKVNGKITSTREVELSTDLRTLTITERPAGQHRPKSVLVFERE